MKSEAVAAVYSQLMFALPAYEVTSQLTISVWRFDLPVKDHLS